MRISFRLILQYSVGLVLIWTSLGFYHLPGHLESRQEPPELNLLAGAGHQSGLQLCQLDEQDDLHLGRQFQSVHVEVNLGENVLQTQAWNNEISDFMNWKYLEIFGIHL